MSFTRTGKHALRSESSDIRLAAILETIADPILLLDKTGAIVFANRTALRLFGYDPELIAGSDVSVLIAEFGGERSSGFLDPWHRGSERSVPRVTCRHRDGGAFAAELAVDRIAGEELYIAVLRDLSARERTERRLADLQLELLHVSRVGAMGERASAFAHELNQPLTAIMNYANAAQRTLEGESDAPPRVRNLVDKIADQALRAGAIIRNLRSFVEKREAVKRPEDLNGVVDEAIALAMVGSAETGVKLVTGFAAHLGPVMVDRIQIQQVVINLVRNSLEAMQQPGERILRVGTGRGDEGFAEVCVADTGPGLREDIAGRLFEPFVTTKQGGMGMGLAICRSIVEGHGGRIWTLENAGRGMAFYFQVPMLEGSGTV